MRSKAALVVLAPLAAACGTADVRPESTARRARWSPSGLFDGFLDVDQLTPPFQVGQTGLVSGSRDSQAAYWAAPGSDILLVPLIDDIAGDRSRVHDIADSGRMVGVSNLDNDPRAFLFDPATDELVNLGTVDGKNSWARAITDTGLIAGFVEDDRVAGNMAVIWDPSGTFSVGAPPVYVQPKPCSDVDLTTESHARHTRLQTST